MSCTIFSDQSIEFFLAYITTFAPKQWISLKIHRQQIRFITVFATISDFNFDVMIILIIQLCQKNLHQHMLFLFLRTLDQAQLLPIDFKRPFLLKNSGTVDILYKKKTPPLARLFLNNKKFKD